MIHETANIYGGAVIPLSTRVGAFCDIASSLGEGCKVQAHVSIPKGWTIGNNVFVGPGARLANDKLPSTNDEWDMLEGVIEDDVVIGMGALIGPGITLGKGCIIGMGAVVLKDVSPGVTVVGNPAHAINS